MERLRKITVDGHALRWRFNRRDKVVVIPAGRSGPQLYISWGWRDHFTPDGPGEDPQLVTPSFVAEAIRFAIKQGWDSVAKTPLHIHFKRDRFTIVRSEAEGIDPNDRTRD